MKTSPILASTTAAVLLANPALSADSASPKIEIKPVALTLKRAMPPTQKMGFGSFNQNRSSDGTIISATARLDDSFDGKLMPGAAKITSFEDNRGTDLQPREKEGKRIGMFGERFQSVSVSPQGTDGALSLRFQSDRVPAKGATSITVKGTLGFSPDDATSDLKHGELELTPKTTVEIGDAMLRFTKGSSHGGFSRSKDIWYVQIVPGPNMMSPEIVLFGEDEDLPILNTADHSRVMTSSVSSDADDPFHGITGRGFSCEANKLSRIKIRFFKKDALIEVPFEFKLGMGDFGSPGSMN